MTRHALSLWKGRIAIHPARAMLRPMLEAHCDNWGVTTAALLGPSRELWVHEARCAFYAKAHGIGFSYEVIGRFVGRHHSDVLRGVRRHHESDEESDGPDRTLSDSLV